MFIGTFFQKQTKKYEYLKKKLISIKSGVLIHDQPRNEGFRYIECLSFILHSIMHLNQIANFY